MDSSEIQDSFESFAIITPNLFILPTPIAVSLVKYRTLYARLHSDESFCQMGFGPHFAARHWNDDETRKVIEIRDINRSWKRYALGDFALGLRPGSLKATLQKDDHKGSVIKGDAFNHLVGSNLEHLDEVQWIGYTGVRDATTTSLPAREANDPVLPPWREMIEVRYGVSPEFWGRGIAKEAAEAVIQWAVNERGARRFIAETERHNERSARVLRKLGFVASGTDYWKEPSEVEWELVVQKV
ncbi:GNAT domain-containing protein [Aspergillus ambiguus]|uniref:GNAT family N-acetyltransferase n=1 Tax=Aspergillus ambiguus TaxID=176160 RepID=UPI003CCC9399